MNGVDVYLVERWAAMMERKVAHYKLWSRIWFFSSLVLVVWSWVLVFRGDFS